MSDILRNPANYEAALSHEVDSTDVLSFGSYRHLCDAIDGFRKVGIQEEESYQRVLDDERTIFTEYAACKIPLLSPLEYEKMYDAERCKLISGKKNAMLLAIPFSALEQMQLEAAYEIDKDTVVIVEEFVAADEPVKLDHHDASRLPFTNAAPFDFKNPALSRSPHNETAWMAAYRFDMLPRGDLLRPYEGGRLADTIVQAWHEHCIEAGYPTSLEGNSTGTFLLSADQLAQRPDIVAQLWDISQIGFGKILGAHHPISMEFNKQFFDRQIVADNTVTAIHCVDGEVACFGFVGLDMKNNEWLNDESSILQREISKAQAEHKALVHFHELIGRGQRGMGYATKILNAFFDAASRTEYPYSVFFESTNLSSMYIPPLIVRDLDRSPAMARASDIDIIGKLSYWALVAQQHGNSDA